MKATTKAGKEGTRGEKLIVQENQETLKFYSYIILATYGVYLALAVVLFWSKFTWGPMFGFIFAAASSGLAYYAMLRMAAPTYSGNQLLSSGIDLNMKQGLAEHLKDVILGCAITTALALISNYFWWLLLAIPAYGFYLLWVNVLGPWFFAPAPEDSMDEKKLKKMERKKKRMVQM